jgi:23S rRNA (uracil1939-C5)-methyltransferase
MALEPGSDVELTIEKPAAGGRMIARHEGQVVLVGGAIPGEVVRARIERVARGVTYAHAVEIVSADPDRRGTIEEHTCGGMVYAHVAYPRQLVLKAAVLADAFGRIGRILLDKPIPVSASPERGYRMRARCHVQGHQVGFFREGTHEVCDPATTGQLLPATCEVLARLADRVHDGRAQSLISLELAENVPATERALHLTLARPPAARDFADLRVEGVSGASYEVSAQGGRGVAFGNPVITDVLPVATASGTAEVTLQRHVTAFFQANRYLLPALVSRVVSLAGEGEVVDLYAGVGSFALSLAAAGHARVVAVEGDRTSADDLRGNAARHAGAVRVFAMPVERFLQDRTPSPGTTLIVDPPRTGMTREAVAGILAQRASRLVYVSCDVATLARDAGRLVQAGYRIEHLEAFDLFPNTAHVEALAVFDRTGGA